LCSIRTPFWLFGHPGGFHVSRALPRFAPAFSTEPNGDMPGLQPQRPCAVVHTATARPGVGHVPEPGRATGEIQLLFDEKQLKKRPGAALDGDFTAEVAIRTLLNNGAFTLIKVGSTYVVRPDEARPPAAARSNWTP